MGEQVEKLPIIKVGVKGYDELCAKFSVEVEDEKEGKSLFIQAGAKEVMDCLWRRQGVSGGHCC